MTLAEANTRIEYYFSELGYRLPPTGTLKKMLNLYANEIALELNFPTRYIKDIDATAAFSLPDEARYNGLYYLELSTQRGAAIQMLNIEEANEMFPDWEDYTETLSTAPFCFVLYDPKNVSAGVTPFGFQAGDTLNGLYVKTVTAVEQPEDIFWDGELVDYHKLIVDKFMYMHLRLKKDSSGTGFKADYQKELEEAFNYLQHKSHMPVNTAMRQKAEYQNFEGIMRRAV